MFTFLGSRFSSNKTVDSCLKKTQGLGEKNINNILCSIGCLRALELKNLREVHFSKVQRLIFFLRLVYEKDIVKQVSLSRCEFLRIIKHRRAIRLLKGLPVRGQRTKTNAKTAKQLLIK